MHAYIDEKTSHLRQEKYLVNLEKSTL